MSKPYDISAANQRQSDFYRSVGGRRAPEDEALETARGEAWECEDCGRFVEEVAEDLYESRGVVRCLACREDDA